VTGDALFIALLLSKQLENIWGNVHGIGEMWQVLPVGFPHMSPMNECSSHPAILWTDLNGRDWHLNGLLYFIVTAQILSFIMYFSLCGTLQWYFYISRRDRNGEWKCQPGKFLSPSQEANEILIGCFNAFTANCGSAILACYLYNGGETKLYFNISDYGWIYFVISFPLLFLYSEAVSYYLHRLMHKPFLYKHLHKWHHYYTTPTAFSVSAFHPVEFWFFQLVHFLPVFVWPLQALVFVSMLLYNYYFGMIDHSGVYIESIFPWQQPSLFHDYHHKYSTCNFGMNTTLFDIMHGTIRKIHQWTPVMDSEEQK
jgi:lathosterol oxidase